MTTSSNPQSEKARAVHSALLRRVSELKQTAIADAMGVSESTVSRTINDDLEKIARLLVAIGMVPARDDALVVDPDEIRAFKTLAFKYMAQQQKAEGV